jgi:hypothetical protein
MKLITSSAFNITCQKEAKCLLPLHRHDASTDGSTVGDDNCPTEAFCITARRNQVPAAIAVASRSTDGSTVGDDTCLHLSLQHHRQKETKCLLPL